MCFMPPTLMVEVANTSETLVNCYETTRHNIQKTFIYILTATRTLNISRGNHVFNKIYVYVVTNADFFQNHFLSGNNVGNFNLLGL